MWRRQHVHHFGVDGLFYSLCLGKKGISCFKEFTLVTDKGAGKGKVEAVL